MRTRLHGPRTIACIRSTTSANDRYRQPTVQIHPSTLMRPTKYVVQGNQNNTVNVRELCSVKYFSVQKRSHDVHLLPLQAYTYCLFKLICKSEFCAQYIKTHVASLSLPPTKLCWSMYVLLSCFLSKFTFSPHLTLKRNEADVLMRTG